MVTKVYVSGQISGLEEAEYLPLFDKAEDYLNDVGYIAVNPLKVKACQTENCNHTAEEDKTFLGNGDYMHHWSCYMRHDIKALLDCDAIALLPNFINSRGAAVELEVAEAIGLPVWFFTHDLNGFVP